MKHAFTFLFAMICSAVLTAQQFPEAPVLCGGIGDNVLHSSGGKVKRVTEWAENKKTGRRSIAAIREYEQHGCITKVIYPEKNTAGGNYSANSYAYDAKGYRIAHRQVMFNKDSNEVVLNTQRWKIDQQDRYSEYHCVYSDPRPGYTPQNYNHEDFYYAYDSIGYALITLQVKLQNKDTVDADYYFFRDKATPEVFSLRQWHYFPDGKLSLRIADDGKNTLEFILYKNTKAIDEESHMVYTYEKDAAGNIKRVTEYEVKNGKKEKKHEYINEDGYTTTTITYENGKEIGRDTERRPYGTPPPDEKPLTEDNSQCQPKVERKTDKKGNTIVSTWLECPGSTERKELHTAVFYMNGLLKETENASEETRTVYGYEFY